MHHMNVEDKIADTIFKNTFISNTYKNQLIKFAEKAMMKNKIDFCFPSGSLILVPENAKTRFINATVKKYACSVVIYFTLIESAFDVFLMGVSKSGELLGFSEVEVLRYFVVLAERAELVSLVAVVLAHLCRSVRSMCGWIRLWKFETILPE